MTVVHAYAASQAHAPLTPFDYTLPDLGPHQVDIRVEYCGICHSDLAMIDNDWGMSSFPVVPGHEVVGTIQAKGDLIQHLDIGQRVGLGWFSASCMHCHYCFGGDQNLCKIAEQTIVGRYGGFADSVRANGEWVIPLPETLSPQEAGPLFCGGITVFNPLVQYDVRPMHRVGVIGIGGLGHMALKFLNKWGCEVTAFTSSTDKAAEAKQLGAHEVVNSRDSRAMQNRAGYFDFILNTTNANLDWSAYINALAPRGRLHTVGTVPDSIPVPAFAMIQSQRSLSGSPLGSPATIQDMLAFCARHQIVPVTEHFTLANANQALEHLRAGKARYRLVLDQTS